METGIRNVKAWQFDFVTVDCESHRVLVDGAPRDLEPKAFRLLTYLIENRERALTKDEIIRSVWNGTAVSDNAITRAVAQIRKAIGDDPREPKFIETVPTVGYRFIGEAQRVDSEPVAVAAAPHEPQTDSGHSVSRRLALAVSAVALLATGWFFKHQSDVRFLADAVSRVEQYASEGRYEEAHVLAKEVLGRDPANARILPLVSEISDVLTVRTTPPGASVYLRRSPKLQEEFAGTSPIDAKAIPRGEYLVTLRKSGYADYERSLSSRLARSSPINRKPWDLRLDISLEAAGTEAAHGPRIEATEHKLAAYSRPFEATVKLDAYRIDRYEVTNREFKSFVDRGGYTKAELWRDPSVREALKDKTGVRAPRGWVGGAFPDGKGDHPVSGVTWHEAYAYCRFRGGSLPTVFEWEHAARGAMQSPFGVVFPWGLAEGSEVAKRANFEGTGTAPVGQFRLGMSPYGVHDMAGNVSEWLLNAYDSGYTTAGGGWSDPVYTFGLYQPRPALYSDAALGFRCVVADNNHPQNEQASMKLTAGNRPLHYPVSSRAQFEATRRGYRNPAAPLNAKVVGVQQQESWKREEIEFDGFAGKRAKAYLYLPRNAAEPYQTIHYLGGTGLWLGVPVTGIIEDGAARMAPFLRTGRAVFLMVLQGFHGREPVGAYGRLQFGSPQHLEILHEWAVDMERGMDYLMSRPDIDRKRIAFWNTSTVESGLVFAALDGRYAATIWNGVGVHEWLLRVPAEGNALHFAPHIPGPKLVMTGRYDEQNPAKIASADPVFRLLAEPKRQFVYLGGHVPATEVVVPAVNAFLDEAMGALKKR